MDGPAFPPIVIMHPEDMQLLILVTLFEYNVTHGKQTREKGGGKIRNKNPEGKNYDERNTVSQDGTKPKAWRVAGWGFQSQSSFTDDGDAGEVFNVPPLSLTDSTRTLRQS